MNLETDARRRLITGLLLGTALLCVWYWVQAGLSAGLFSGLPAAGKPAVDAVPATPAVVAGTPAELARVLGAPRPVLSGSALGPAERFRAVGVVASASGQGAALIAVDKQAPRPFRVGASVAPGFVLKAVKLREVTLVDSLQVEVSLPLPDPAKTKPEERSTEARNGNAPATLPNPPDAEAGPPTLPSIRGEPRAP